MHEEIFGQHTRVILSIDEHELLLTIARIFIMKNLLFVVSVLSVFISFSVSAKWEVGASFHKFSETFSNDDIDLNVVSLSVSYQLQVADKWKVTPEFKIGAGSGSHTTTNSLFLDGLENFTELDLVNAELEVDRYYSFGLKLEYYISPTFYGYLLLSYSEFDISTVANSGNASFEFNRDNKDKFGIGFGLGYQFNDTVRSELGIQRFGSDNFVGVSFKYAF
jgi:hypothetical protein